MPATLLRLRIRTSSSECMLKKQDLKGGDLYGLHSVATAESCKELCMADWKCKVGNVLDQRVLM